MRRVSFAVLCACAAGVLAGAAAPLGFLIFDSGSARPGRLPEGWRVKAHRGTPDVAVIREGQQHILHLKSRNSSFALERAVDVDPARTPYLAWRWKVTELPRGADFRRVAPRIRVRVSGRLRLGHNWADQVTVYREQTLVQTGVYGLVRHPLYASLIWMFVGGSLIFRNLAALAATLAVFVPAMAIRARQEEALLAMRFPEHEAYRRRVGMLWPRLWPKGGA